MAVVKFGEMVSGGLVSPSLMPATTNPQLAAGPLQPPRPHFGLTACVSRA